MAAAALVAGLRFVPETGDPAARRPDVLGAVLLAASLVAIVYPPLEGRTFGWPAWVLLVLAAGVAGLFVQVAFSAGMQGFFLTFALWLQAGEHFSPLKAGLTAVAFSVGEWVAASHVGVNGSPWPVVPGLVVAGAGLALLVIPLVNVVLAEVAGGASGLFGTAQQLGGALGVAVLSMLLPRTAMSEEALLES